MEPIMVIHVTIDPVSCSTMEMPDGRVTIIPFGGTVESDFFTGVVMPGAADVQVTNPAGVCHMNAQYMLEGTDNTGEKCRIFIQNQGYFERDSHPQPFEAWPTIRTDSKALRPFLHGIHFRAEGYGTPNGVDIKIYDTDKEE